MSASQSVLQCKVATRYARSMDMTTSAHPTVAHFDSICKKYRRQAALTDITLQITAGEAVGLVGPNGAGKTTLLALLAGLRRPTCGTVRLFGGDPTNPRSRTRLGMAPQALSLPETARVGEVLAYVQAFYQKTAKISKLVEEFNIGHLLGRQVGGLSGGQRRLVTVALAFVGNPKLVLLDEPTTGLDDESRELLWTRVAARVDAGTTLIVTSHYLEDIERLSQRVVALKEGRVVQDAPITDIRAASRLAKVRISTTTPDAYHAIYRHGESHYRNGVLEFITDDLDETLRWALHNTGTLNNIEVVNNALSAASRNTRIIDEHDNA